VDVRVIRMIRKGLFAFVLTFLVMECVLVTPSSAVRLLTEEEALKEMFPDADDFVNETRVLDPDQMAELKERIKKLVLYQKGSQSEMLAEKNNYVFYFAMKDGERIGVAVMEMQPGKWGPVQFIIALDMDGKVTNLAVMFYVEQRGRPIARRSFLGQFIGKSSGNTIAVRKDIRAISGATISSRCTAFTVRKVIALYENLYLDGVVTSEKKKF
jgi:Na+-translocating ferredoxin:NAD+ oxidoreductase RnfG subunit